MRDDTRALLAHAAAHDGVVDTFLCKDEELVEAYCDNRWLVIRREEFRLTRGGFEAVKAALSPPRYFFHDGRSWRIVYRMRNSA